MGLDAKQRKLADRILELKGEKNAVILAHNYQRPEIYEVADHVGDSYDLSVKATKSDAEIIVFCGVRFMAETAKILNPGKKVLLPALGAGCTMASMMDASAARAWKAKYPDASSVCYINTNADVKAEFDACCTSANSVKVAGSMPARRVLFGPDQNLAQYTQEQLDAKGIDKEIIPWNGFCYAHTAISAQQLAEAMKLRPDAEVIAHPECKKEIRDMAHYVYGTGGMVKRAGESDAKEFIIGTEIGMCERLARDYPGKKFMAAPNSGTCAFMKKTTLQNTLDALEKEQHEVNVPQEIAGRARACIGKMLEIGK